MSYTDVFGSNTVPPSGSSYSKEEIEGTVQGYWPEFVSETGIAVSSILELFSTSVAVIKMPPASQVSVGRDVLILNNGLATITIRDYDNGLIGTLSAGQSRYLFVKENDDEAGLWGTIMYGIGTAYTDAAILDGYGLTAVNTELVQSKVVATITLPDTLEQSHRAALLVVNGGSGQLNLPAASDMPNGFFTTVQNNGGGIITVTPAEGETVNDETTLEILGNGFLTLVSTGSEWKAFGFQNDAGSGTDSFGTIVVTGQDPIVADAVNDSVQLVAGSNITITTNTLNSTITINGADQSSDILTESGSVITAQVTANNSDTLVKTRPTGTGEFSGFVASSEPSGSDESLFALSVGNSFAELSSYATGSGTPKPLLISCNGNVAATVTTTGGFITNGGLSITKTSVTAPAATDGNVFSGSYDPVIVAQTNCTVASRPGGSFTYTRIGNRVSVTGTILVSATAIGTAFCKVSLPISAATGTESNMSGVICGPLNPYGSCAGRVTGSSGDLSYVYVEVYIPKEFPFGPLLGISFSYLVP